jgi:hypothetical protein
MIGAGVWAPPSWATRPERCVFWACADGAEHLRRVPAEEHMLGA